MFQLHLYMSVIVFYLHGFHISLSYTYIYILSYDSWLRMSWKVMVKDELDELVC